MKTVQDLFDYNRAFRIPSMRISDILEIVIIAFLVYHVLLWAKKTRLWSMLKGIIVIIIFILLAVLFNMNTWSLYCSLSFEKRWKNLEERIFSPICFRLET